jgi:hypothetical protein
MANPHPFATVNHISLALGILYVSRVPRDLVLGCLMSRIDPDALLAAAPPKATGFKPLRNADKSTSFLANSPPGADQASMAYAPF